MRRWFATARTAPPFDALRSHLISPPSPGHLYSARTTLDVKEHPSTALRFDNSQALAIKPLNALHRRLELYSRERMEHEDRIRQRVNRICTTATDLQEADLHHQTGSDAAAAAAASASYNKSIEFATNFDTTNASIRVPRGLYLHGTVGTGKSLCMDLLYEASTLTKKRRVHFHDFMSETHQRVHEWKMKQPKIDIGHRRKDGSRYIQIAPESDALLHVASEISNEAWLLCFDEFQVTDVADALIMTKLFGTMWKNGTVVVATSNRAPSQLYENGLNRHYFMPFIGALEQTCKLHSMDSSLDHRMLTQKDHIRSGYIVIDSSDPQNSQVALDKMFETAVNLCIEDGADEGGKDEDKVEDKVEDKIEGDTKVEVESLEHLLVPTAFGRTLKIPRADCRGGVVRFQFDQLCSNDLGAADFLSLAQRFHTIAIYDIPKMNRRMHNEARRFIMLIDQLYECRTRLLCTAAADPLELLSKMNNDGSEHETDTYGRDIQGGELAAVKELSFAYQRAASRLVEMQSVEYDARVVKYRNILP